MAHMLSQGVSQALVRAAMPSSGHDVSVVMVVAKKSVHKTHLFSTSMVAIEQKRWPGICFMTTGGSKRLVSSTSRKSQAPEKPRCAHSRTE